MEKFNNSSQLLHSRSDVNEIYFGWTEYCNFNIIIMLQIGPANLVRGKVARANSLNISLLQRLEKQYLSSPNCHIIAKLSSNYRCHPEILNLISDLFYNSSLQWNDEETEPTTHRKYPYPLVFICSGIDESAGAQDMEAEIIINKVIELAKQTPSAWNSKPMKNYLITSPCENQVSGFMPKPRPILTVKNISYDGRP